MNITQLLMSLLCIFMLVCGYYAGREDGYKDGHAIGYRRGQAIQNRERRDA